MRNAVVAAALMMLAATAPAEAAPAVAHLLIVQHPDQQGDPARYVARAQRCKDEFFKELRLVDGRVPTPGQSAGPRSFPPNPAIRQVLDEGGVASAQVVAAAINVCLEAQGLGGVKAVVSPEPAAYAPLE